MELIEQLLACAPATSESELARLTQESVRLLTAALQSGMPRSLSLTIEKGPLQAVRIDLPTYLASIVLKILREELKGECTWVPLRGALPAVLISELRRISSQDLVDRLTCSAISAEAMNPPSIDPRATASPTERLRSRARRKSTDGPEILIVDAPY